jgi:hypothetical protein
VDCPTRDREDARHGNKRDDASARLSAFGAVRGGVQSINGSEDLTRVIAKHFTRGRQFDAARFAAEHLGIQVILEISHLSGQGGLREPKSLRGAAKAA